MKSLNGSPPVPSKRRGQPVWPSVRYLRIGRSGGLNSSQTPAAVVMVVASGGGRVLVRLKGLFHAILVPS
jgi:hypothetical protein